MGLFERAPGSVTGGTVRKTMAWIGGRGWVDPVPGADEMRQGGAALSRTTTTSSTSYEDSSTGSEEGSVVLGGSIGSSSGEDIGDGIRVLDDELVKSPVAI